MTFKEKLKIIINKRYPSPKFIRHDGEYFCNKWWCNPIKIETVLLSEIKSNLKSVQFEPYHKQIEYEILEKGFDYKKGYIYLTSKNVIIDGHHRYFILKKNFDDSLQITVYKLMDVNNRYFHLVKLLFIHLFIWFMGLFRKNNKGQIIELEL